MHHDLAEGTDRAIGSGPRLRSRTAAQFPFFGLRVLARDGEMEGG
jgi:hypothetical protein